MSYRYTALPRNRWHIQHGPIDLIIAAEGSAAQMALSVNQCIQQGENVLNNLVEELRFLYAPLNKTARNPMSGDVARLMWESCLPFSDAFITPMAAVAGAVAQTLLQPFQREGLEKAWINNGGDIAFLLKGDATMRIGVVGDLHRSMSMQQVHANADLVIRASDAVGGVATSGWGGRSFSFGIADSVTVVAKTAAMADAAATMIANAVNVDHALIVRQPANTLKDQTDLGDRLVTVRVPPLPRALIDEALHAGIAQAAAFQARGLIDAAVLHVQSHVATLGLAQAERESDLRVDGSAARLTYALSHQANISRMKTLPMQQERLPQECLA